MSLLKINNLAVNFGGIKALSNINLNVKTQSIHSIIGPNGAGKTTLLNIISGIYPIQTGTISFADQNLYAKITLKQKLLWALASIFAGITFLIIINLQTIWTTAITNNFIFGENFYFTKAFKDLFLSFYSNLNSSSLLFSILFSLLIYSAINKTVSGFRQSSFAISELGLARTFQNIRLFQNLTCLQNVMIGFHRDNFHESEQEAKQLLDLVGLIDLADKAAATISYGDQRRLEIARALATQPKLLLLDEPAAGMNPAEAKLLIDLLFRLKERGLTILIIEHNMNLIMKVSDMITVLNYGEKIAEGTAEQIRLDPIVIDAYLGKAH